MKFCEWTASPNEWNGVVVFFSSPFVSRVVSEVVRENFSWMNDERLFGVVRTRAQKLCAQSASDDDDDGCWWMLLMDCEDKTGSCKECDKLRAKLINKLTDGETISETNCMIVSYLASLYL